MNVLAQPVSTETHKTWMEGGGKWRGFQRQKAIQASVLCYSLSWQGLHVCGGRGFEGPEGLQGRCLQSYISRIILTVLFKCEQTSSAVAKSLVIAWSVVRRQLKL